MKSDTISVTKDELMCAGNIQGTWEMQKKDKKLNAFGIFLFS